MSQSGIYIIKNQQTNQVYVGSAINLNNRWYRHRWELQRNTHHCIRLQRAWNKYGEQGFAFLVVEKIQNKIELIEKEQIWLTEFLTSGRAYNSSPIAGSQLGFRHSASSKKLMSNKHKGRALGPHSKETKQKLSTARMGERNPYFKGDIVGYNGLRSWIRTRKSKTECELCHTKINLDLVSENPSRNPNDWIWLCRRCHMKKDGRINLLKETAIQRRLPDLTCEGCHAKIYKKDSRVRFCSQVCAGFHRQKIFENKPTKEEFIRLYYSMTKKELITHFGVSEWLYNRWRKEYGATKR